MFCGGRSVFEMNDAEIPATWSQLATDIVVSKYFRKAGVPQVDASGNPVVAWTEIMPTGSDIHVMAWSPTANGGAGVRNSTRLRA